MKNFQTNIFLIVFILGISQSHATLSINDKATWINEHQADLNQKQSDDYGSSYLLFDQQIIVKDQTQAEYIRIVAQVNNSHGLTDLGKISIAFDPTYQSLQVHNVTIIRDMQPINVLEQVEFELIRQESELSHGIYNGKETALLLLEDLHINDVLDYDYTITGKNPIFNNHVFEVFGLEWSIPVRDLHIKVSIPKNKKINYRTHKNQATPKKTSTSNRVDYTWHLQNIQAIDYQGNYPAWYVASDYLELSEFRNWNQVAKWAAGVFAIDTSLDVETHALVRTWQQSNDALAKTAKALKFVQDKVRYLGIEIGVNSHKPRPPSETYATKYGDCKDKTMLLHAMLKAMNIDSKPLLVSTELDKGIVDMLPSPGLFNHVILQVRINGSTYWIDPTVTNQGSSLISLSLPDFAYGLVIDEQTKALSPIKRLDTQINRKTTIELLNIAAKKTTIPLQIETQNYGQFAENWRSSFAANSKRQIQNQFESHTNQIYGNATTNQNIEVNDDISENKLTIKEHYELKEPWKQNIRFEYIETFAHSLLAYVELPSRINRDSPLGLPYPLSIEHQFIINDSSKEIEVDEKSIDVKTDQIAYSKTVVKKDQQIIISHQLQILKDHVKVIDLEQYYDAIKSIKVQLSAMIGLPIEQKARLKESNDRLKSALQKMLKEKGNE